MVSRACFARLTIFFYCGTFTSLIGPSEGFIRLKFVACLNICHTLIIAKQSIIVVVILNQIWPVLSFNTSVTDYNISLNCSGYLVTKAGKITFHQ
jgi:hypothetical protein